MAVIGEMEAKITGDASGLLGAIGKAQGAISGFASIAGGVFAGIGLASIFSSVTSGLESMVTNIVKTGEDFQSWGAVMDAVGGDVGDIFDDMGASAGGGGAKVKSSILEVQDALIRYNQKIKDTNDNIAEVMKGKNVIDAKSDLVDKLTSLDESYAEKVKSIYEQIDQADNDLVQKREDRARSLADRLKTMEEDHLLSMEEKKISGEENVISTLSKNEDDFSNKMADKKAKLESDKASALNNLQRKALQKKYDIEVELETKAFNEDQARKKKQMEITNAKELASAEAVFQRKEALIKTQEEKANSEADARDQKAYDKKVTNLKESLTKENAVHEAQQAKLKADGEQHIKDLEEQNAKKLENYKRELADEERAFALSQAKRAASESGGGGGGGGSSNLKLTTKNIQVGDDFAKSEDSAKNLFKYLSDISSMGNPFPLESLEKTSQSLAMMNIDAEAMLPTIMNLGGHFQKDLGTVTSTILQATRGNVRGLQSQFGITGAALQEAFGPEKIKSSNDVLKALKSIVESKFGDGIAIESSKGSTATIPLQNAVYKMKLAFMGLDEVTGKPIKGGLFESIMLVMGKVTDFMVKNEPAISKFLESLGKGIVKIGNFMLKNKPTFDFFIKKIEDIYEQLKPLGEWIINEFVPWLVLFAQTIADNVNKAMEDLKPDLDDLSAKFIQLWNDTKPLREYIIEKVIPALVFIAEIIIKIVIWAIKQVINWIQDWLKKWTEIYQNFKTNMEVLSDRWKTFSENIKTAVDDIIGFLGKLIKPAQDLWDKLNPFKRNSPSLVDNVLSGVGIIKDAYSSIGAMKITAPSIQASGAMGKTYNFSNQTTNAPTVNQTNNFNVAGEANADNIAERLGFQIEHYGVV